VVEFYLKSICLCDVTLSVYPHRAGLKNMPGHGWNICGYNNVYNNIPNIYMFGKLIIL
jgi:hypothetical protein